MHILSDLTELDDLIKQFSSIKEIIVIGGTDEWYSQPIYENILNEISKIKNIKLTEIFNPINSDTNKVVDLYVNGKLDCMIKIRSVELSPNPKKRKAEKLLILIFLKKPLKTSV